MKILHLADIHMGLQTHSRPDPETGLPSRLLDVARSWHRAAEIAVDRGVDAVIVAGDVFHKRNPDAATLNLFAHGLRVLEEADIPTVVIAGNHDGAQHPGQRSVLELFHRPPSVFVSTRPEILDIDGLRVATLPWVSRQGLMAAHPDLSRADASERFFEGLAQVLGMLRAEGADVLTGHWSVQGAHLGVERDLDISITGEHVIPLAELEGPWSYAALGHIHKQQEMPQQGSTRIAYAGSVDRVSFGEEGELKVALEVSLDGGGIQEHTLPAREFQTFDLTAEQAADPEWVEAMTVGAICRVRLHLTEAESMAVDRAALQRSLYDAGAHHVVMEVEVERAARPRAERVTEALGPLDAFEEFMSLKDVAEEERPALRDMAKKLIEGEDR